MNRLAQPASESRASITRLALIGALAVALIMPSTEAWASGWHFSTGEKVAIVSTLLFVGGTGVATGVALISNGIDLFGEPEPKAWDAGSDIALSVPNAAFCALGLISFNPQDDGLIAVTAATCSASALLLSHGLWELWRLDEMDSPDSSSKEGGGMSFAPTILDAKGAVGLGVVGRF